MMVTGGTRIDFLEGVKGVYLNGEHSSISKLKNGSTVPSAPFTVEARGIEVEVHAIDFSLDGASFVPILPTGVTFADDVVTIDPAAATFKTLSIRASAEDTMYQDVFTITVVEDGKDGDQGPAGTNYLIPVDWKDDVQYRLTDAGIPVVRVEDGTSLGFSVYRLIQNLTAGHVGMKPGDSGWNWGEYWQLVDSNEYIYLQDAYIERLQAALVTAEMIQSLVIETGNLKVKEGAEIAGFDVVGNSIVSQAKDSQGNPLLVLEGSGGETVITGTFLSNSNGSKIKIDPVNRCVRLLTSNNQVLGEWWFNDSSPSDIASTLDLHHYYNNVRTSTLRLGGVNSSMSIITYNASGTITGRSVYDYNGYRKLI